MSKSPEAGLQMQTSEPDDIRTEQPPSDPDSLRAEQAFWDYFRCNGNLSELRREYQRRRDEGESYPTLRKDLLTQWKQKYDWDGRIRAEAERNLEEERKNYEQIRRSTIDRMNAFSPTASEKLMHLITNQDGSVPHRVQLMAIESLLDRIGIGKKDTASAQTPSGPGAVPTGASEEDLQRAYAELNNK